MDEGVFCEQRLLISGLAHLLEGLALDRARASGTMAQKTKAAVKVHDRCRRC
jgi:hypothetical protein